MTDFVIDLNDFFSTPFSTTQSEDCLFLNVFAPIDASPSSKLPVMFWIYGGNLQEGSTTLSEYTGASMAGNQDVVVVTINYRVGGMRLYQLSHTLELTQNDSLWLHAVPRA